VALAVDRVRLQALIFTVLTRRVALLELPLLLLLLLLSLVTGLFFLAIIIIIIIIITIIIIICYHFNVWYLHLCT
jgi:hypothetical protein